MSLMMIPSRVVARICHTHYTSLRRPSSKKASTDKDLSRTRKIPASLTNIFFNKSKVKKPPPSWYVSYIARQFTASKVGLIKTEETLRAVLKCPPLDVLSKTLAHQFAEAKSSDKRVEALKGLISICTQVTENIQIRDRCDRLNYFLTVWRLAEICEKCVKSDWELELSIIKEEASKLYQEQGEAALIYIYFMTVFKHNSDTSLRLANDLLKSDDSFLSELISNVRMYASKDFTSDHSRPTSATHPGIPTAFIFGDLNTFSDRFKQLEVTEAWTKQFDAFRALALWNAGNRSDSMSLIAQVFEYFCGLDKKSPEFLWVGKAAIASLSPIIKEVVELDLTPAHDFLDVMSEKITGSNGLPIVPYIYHIHLRNSGSTKNMVEAYPSINSIRDVKFEKILLNSVARYNLLDGNVVKYLTQIAANEGQNPKTDRVLKSDDYGEHVVFFFKSYQRNARH